MLLRQDGRRHQDRHLITAIHGFEGRPHRHFRLAETHIAAQQSIHRPRPQHVALDRRDRRQLIGRLAVGK